MAPCWRKYASPCVQNPSSAPWRRSQDTRPWRPASISSPSGKFCLDAAMLASASPGDDASFLNYKKDTSDLFKVRFKLSFLKGDFLNFFIFMYIVQHCFICRPPDSNVSEDAGIESRTVATFALTVRRSNHLGRSHHDYHFCLMPNHPPHSTSLFLILLSKTSNSLFFEFWFWISPSQAEKVYQTKTK
jgi:hypothetical protein